MSYQEILEKYGVTQEQVREMFLNDNYVNIGDRFTYLKDSKIEGLGVFTALDLKAGSFIAYARFMGQRTQVGRFMNHSDTPNCEFVEGGRQVMIFSLTDIKRDEELTCDYAINIERLVLKK